jgi:hypothetical protein
MARWPIKLILDKNSTWSQLFKANLNIIPWVSKKRSQKLGYTFMDKIIFCHLSGFGKLQYTKNIWNAWSELRKYLEYKIKNNMILGYWAIEDAIKIMAISNNYYVD